MKAIPKDERDAALQAALKYCFVQEHGRENHSDGAVRLMVNAVIRAVDKVREQHRVPGQTQNK